MLANKADEGFLERTERGRERNITDSNIPSPLRSTGLPWLLPIWTECLTLAVAAAAACNPIGSGGLYGQRKSNNGLSRLEDRESGSQKKSGRARHENKTAE